VRILIAHSRYASGDASGENRVVDDECTLLEQAGHEVAALTPVSTPTSSRDLLALGASAVWSRSAARQLAELQADFRPDVVHFHNLFPQLSPLALRTAALGGAAVVVTLHNYRLLCPPATFLLHGAPCERCLGKVPWRAVVHGCYRGSRLGSAALAGSLTLHRGLGTFDLVDRYFAVSEFVRSKHVAAGFDPDAIVVKPNFVPPAPRRQGAGRYFLFLGRLSSEKGVAELLGHWRRIEAPLLIVGDGAELPRLRELAPPGVEFRGQIPGAQVGAVIADARAVVVPSRAYEGAPRVVIEAYAAGVPVLGVRAGALPELVEEGVTGRLAALSDRDAWVAAAAGLLDDAESMRLGSSAYELWRRRYSPEAGLEALENGYADARRRAEDRRTSGRRAGLVREQAKTSKRDARRSR
jgi:glycosyltransferase involved in cell wall biosynthesis